MEKFFTRLSVLQSRRSLRWNALRGKSNSDTTEKKGDPGSAWTFFRENTRFWIIEGRRRSPTMASSRRGSINEQDIQRPSSLNGHDQADTIKGMARVTLPFAQTRWNHNRIPVMIDLCRAKETHRKRFPFFFAISNAGSNQALSILQSSLNIF